MTFICHGHGSVATAFFVAVDVGAKHHLVHFLHSEVRHRLKR